MTRIKRAFKVIPSDPEWEAAKAHRRSIDHGEAVRESEYLSNQWRSMWRKETPLQLDLGRIISTMKVKRVSFVLIGALAFGGWTGRPRATKDVNLLVNGKRNLTRAVEAIRGLYPQLEIRPNDGASAFFVPTEKYPVIDVRFTHRADLAETFAHPVDVDDRRWRYRIAVLETALANKYGAMRSPTRALDQRYLDMVDFWLMVEHSEDEGQQPIDLAKLEFLGDKVWPGNGGAEILRLVELVKTGRSFNLDDLIRKTS